MRPTPAFKRSLYARARDRAVPRRQAATLAGVSYKTGQRLDDTARRCATCGRPQHAPQEDR